MEILNNNPARRFNFTTLRSNISLDLRIKNGVKNKNPNTAHIKDYYIEV